jgi:uncharacterized protein YllA (UPF0747 family)
LNFEKLPEVPWIWVDFVKSRLSVSPAFEPMRPMPEYEDESLMTRREVLSGLLEESATDSAQVLESIRRLRQRGSVVVAANLYPGFLGGPASQILKCLTAVKACGELAERGTAAIPLCWIDPKPPSRVWPQEVALPDSESELHLFKSPILDFAHYSSADPTPRDPIADLFARIEKFGRGTCDMEILDVLRGIHDRAGGLSSASLRLISDLMGEWGMVVLDSSKPEVGRISNELYAPIHNQSERMQSLLRKEAAHLAEAGYAGELSEDTVRTFLVQSVMLPELMIILDPHEVFSYTAAQPVFDAFGWRRPMAWPRASATVVDARSRRILKRYNLNLDQLFAGEAAVIEQINSTMPRSATGTLNALKSEVETRIAEIGASGHSGNEFMRTAEACRAKILYQLEKLRTRVEAARARKEQVLARQIRTLCSFLAPHQRLQENEFAGLQLLLRFSRAGLRLLYERLDIRSMEHQLIPMD